MIDRLRALAATGDREAIVELTRELDRIGAHDEALGYVRELFGMGDRDVVHFRTPTESRTTPIDELIDPAGLAAGFGTGEIFSSSPIIHASTGVELNWAAIPRDAWEHPGSFIWMAAVLRDALSTIMVRVSNRLRSPHYTSVQSQEAIGWITRMGFYQRVLDGHIAFWQSVELADVVSEAFAATHDVGGAGLPDEVFAAVLHWLEAFIVAATPPREREPWMSDTAAHRILGYDPSLVGEHLVQALPWEDPQVVRDQMVRRLIEIGTGTQ